MRRPWAVTLAVAALGAIGACAGLVAVRQAAAALPPLDLASARDGSTVVLDRHGTLLRPFATADGRWRLPIEVADVDPRFLAMLKVYEDQRFDEHGGIDPRAIARAAWQMASAGRIVSGASTLTMQVARLLEPQAERSLGVKLRQALRALELERRLSKTEILDLYLTLAPYGGNLEGTRAAALAYFGREPKRLSNAEAALLVALPQSPETRRPDRFPAAARAARDRVLAIAEARGLVTAEERAAASREPIPEARRAFPMLAAHAAEQAVAERPGERLHRLAIDARWQQSLEQLVRERLQRLPAGLSAAILVIDNETGEIRARIGSAAYLDRDRAGAIDMTQAIRSPGSALKPFVYSIAFETGLAHPETLVDDRPSRFGLYAPENFDLTYQGTVTARKALQMSLNVPAVELLSQIGTARFLARLKQAGAEIVLPKEAAPGLAIGLGGLGLSLADLTRLYAGLARGGEAPVLASRFGETPAALPTRPVADPVAAWYVADILRGAPPPDNALPGRIAYKTGTSYGYRDAWAVGFERRYTIGVWIGRPDNGAVAGLVGRLVAAPILFDALARLGISPEPVPSPPSVLIASTATLPPPLRHIRKDVPKTIAATARAALRIAYPPNGARVDLGLTAEGAETMLAMKVAGGAPPYTWLVNGAPVGTANARRDSRWRPDGAGFARISVIDASGAADSVVVRLE